jgi:hypothetical protein
MPAISGGEHGFGWPARNRRRDLTQPRPVVVDRQRCPRHDPRIDPITLVVTADVLGASACLTDSAEAAVKDA